MRFVLVYGTTEGQTRRIMRFCADRLADRGHSVELLAARDAGDLDPSHADAAILGASLHASSFQQDLRDFARTHRDALAARPTLFLAVSLSAAGHDVEDWKGLHTCIAEFIADTGWTPGRVEHVAGSFRFSEYDFFRTWAMRWIASQKGVALTPGEDKELTDWAALGATLDSWLAAITAPAR